MSLQKPAKIRVSMICHCVPPDYSGAGKQCWQLAQKMPEYGIESGILAFTRNPLLAGDSEMDGIRVRRILLGRRLYLADAAARIAGELKLIFGEGKTDIIQWHGFLKDMLMVLPLKRFTGAKWVFVNSLLDFDDFETIRGYGSLYAKAVSSFDAIISISPALEETYRKYPFFNGKLRLIPQGVNMSKFSPVSAEEKMRLRTQLGLPSDRKILCFAGAVVRRKGVHHLLRLITSLREMPQPPVLLIIGPWKGYTEELSNGYKRELDEYAVKYGIENLLLWTGQVNNVENYMQASDIFVFASHREGFTNTVAEAMSCGLPCVVGNIPGITDILVEDDVTGFIVNPEDSEVFTKIVRKLISEDSLCFEMGQRARERIGKLFSIDGKTKEYSRLYNHLLGAHADKHS